MTFRIILEKENFKFSGSHFTIFGPQSAERMHGHNYYVRAELRLKSLDPALGMAFDFNWVKPMIREACALLDERVLLPSRSPYLQIKAEGESLTASHAGHLYTFPKDDVVLLPVANITSEELARWMHEAVSERLQTDATAFSRIASLAIGVEETRGQLVLFETQFS